MRNDRRCGWSLPFHCAYVYADKGLNAEPLVIRPRLDKPASDIDPSLMLNL